jgi:hypothetical protein
MPVDGPGESSKGFSELHLSNHSFIILYDSVVCVDIAPSLFRSKKY